MACYGGRPQGGWLTSTFIKPRYSQIRCVKREDSTHLRLVGGKYRIPDHLNTDFLAAYSKDIGDAAVKHCLTEVCTDLFPFFLDFDVFDAELQLQDSNSPAVKSQIAAWCQTAIHCISKCAPFTAAAAAEEEEEVSKSVMQQCKDMREKLAPSSSVLMTAPARALTKNELTGTKLGLHLLWPTLIVSKETAQRLRNLVVIELHAQFRGRDWDNIIDSAVYRPMASLRMVGSYKVTKCLHCDLPDIRAARKLEAKQRPRMAQVLHMPVADAGNSRIVRKTVQQALQRQSEPHHAKEMAVYSTAFDACHSCASCKGNFRIPDEAVGVYSLGAVLDGCGELLSDLTDAAQADAFLAVYLCSPRRPDGTQPVQVTFPKHAPAAPRAVLKARPQTEEDEDVDSVCEQLVELQLQPKEAKAHSRFRKASCYSETASCLALQAWLNSGVFSPAYDSVQVASAYRLVSNSASDRGKMMDGGNNYIVIATLRGYGSQYCCNVKRDHTSNHVYFELHSNGTAVQKCHSTHQPGCANACSPALPLPAAVYTSFYPYSKATMLVLPEEVYNWVSGRTSMQWLVQQVGPVFGCTRKDQGVTFKKILQTGRQKALRQHVQQANSSCLGKRPTVEAPETQPDRDCPWEEDDESYC